MILYTFDLAGNVYFLIKIEEKAYFEQFCFQTVALSTKLFLREEGTGAESNLTFIREKLAIF